jgi:hypothetical protein
MLLNRVDLDKVKKFFAIRKWYYKQTTKLGSRVRMRRIVEIHMMYLPLTLWFILVLMKWGWSSWCKLLLECSL